MGAQRGPGTSRSNIGYGARAVRRARREWAKLVTRTWPRWVAGARRRLRPGLQTEVELLRRSWAGRDAEALDRYLVTGFQNPRINVQSILLRHALIRRLFGHELDALMHEELAFAIELNEALRARAAELGVTMGSYLDRRQAAVRQVAEVIADRETVFRDRWHAALADRTAPRLTVLELACGSANDYRAFADYGVARFLDYTGLDLTVANIENARRRFPGVTFIVGNALAVDLPDRSAEVVIVSDLYEHLPLATLSVALAETMRLSRDELVLTFFNMTEAAEHEPRPVELYHWNRLSRRLIEDTLRPTYPDLEVTPIAEWLKTAFAYPDSYNPGAYTIVARRSSAGSSGWHREPPMMGATVGV